VQGYEIGSDLVWDATSLQAYTQQWLARPGVEQEQATVQVRNGAEIGGLAGRVTETLAAAGFTTTAPATDEPVAQSVIIDYTAKPRTRERLQEVLGNMPVEEHSAGEAPPGVDIAVILGADYGSYVGQ
jgi:polyisoprenyl-teichoic acid--peptidoglycan teichoic acid transferase